MAISGSVKESLNMGEKSNHQDVIKKLRSWDLYLGDKLYDFFEERKRADYRLNYNFRPKKADRLVSEMELFLNELKQFLEEV